MTPVLFWGRWLHIRAVVLAAALAGRPCAVAEQNARPGLTNRILGRFVRRIYTAFPEAGHRFPKRR